MSAAKLVARLSAAGLRLAVAESCTGGMLGAAITDVPGASHVFLGGVIAYHNDVKVEHLGVDGALFGDGHGAVSATVAETMAHAARDRFGADVGVAVSGIAGPSGGTAEKPVGTVWLACVGPGGIVQAHRIQVPGDRTDVRRDAVAQAIALVVRNLDEADLEAGED